jgi:membrane protein YdbS with pleckstrin-like domain
METVEQARDDVADGIDHALDPRYIALQRLVGGIVTACLAVGSLPGTAAVMVTADELPRAALAAAGAVWTVTLLAVAWHAQRWPAVAYRHAFYRVGDQGIEIRRGVHWRVVITVPRSRVQHTDVSQGPLERAHGLGTLVIYTAGTGYARVHLPGLAYERALRIRDHLLPRENGDAV